MKKTLLAIASLAALSATALPAAAQTYQRGGGHAVRNDINAEQAQLRNRIFRAEQNGRLSRREAVRLRAELRQIDRLEYGYRANDGRISRREYAVLDARLDRLRMMMRAEIRDDNRRYGAGYGRW